MLSQAVACLCHRAGQEEGQRDVMPDDSADHEAAETQADPTGLKLDASLDMRAASGLAGALLGMRGMDLEVDASEVRRIGGQCLQVLLSAHATWASENHALRIINPSNEFIEGVTLLGAPALGDGSLN